jgi:CRP/FNR family transcriptional regulator, cyclic AMP receptor protein
MMRILNDDEITKSAVKNIITFRFLEDGEVDSLLAVSNVIEYGGDEKIVTEGELSPYFYGIISGTVNVMVRENEGNEVFISALGEGDVFGEAGIFIKMKRTASIAATETVRVLRIHRKDMVHLIKGSPEVGNKILLTIIFGLLRKLRMVNQELAFERKSDMNQDDIDSMMESLLTEGEAK